MTRRFAWQESKKYMLRRSWVIAMQQGTRFTCGICHQPIRRKDKLGKITVDHIVPKSKGGSDEWDNMQPAHRLCNSYKGDDEHFDLVFEVERKLDPELQSLIDKHEHRQLQT